MKNIILILGLFLALTAQAYSQINSDTVSSDVPGGGGSGGGLSQSDIDTPAKLNAFVTPDLADISSSQTFTNKVIDANGNTVKILRHATDCTTFTAAVDGQYCWEQDSDTLYVCETADVCDTAGEWDAVASMNALTAYALVSAGWFDVKTAAYGATGDGTTDDQAAIQSAIDAAELVGGTVFVPDGIYKVNTPLVIDTANVKILCNGWGTSILGGATDQTIFDIQADGVEISNCRIDPPASYSTATTKIGGGVNDSWIHHNWFTGDDYTAGSIGIELVPSTATGVSLNTIENNSFVKLEHQIELDQAVTGSWVNGNRIINNTFLNPATAIYMTGFTAENTTDGNGIAGNQIQSDANLVEGMRIDGNGNMLADNMFWDLNISGNDGINILSTASNTQVQQSLLAAADLTNSGTNTIFTSANLGFLGPGQTIDFSFIGDSNTGIGNPNADRLGFRAGGIWGFISEAAQIRMASGLQLCWASGDANGTACDTKLFRDAANVIAQRNGTTAQEFRVYTTDSGSDDEYFSVKTQAGGNTQIGNVATGTGTERSLEIVSPVITNGNIPASGIANTPSGDIGATDAQGAINELDGEKVSLNGDVMQGILTLHSQGLTIADSGDGNPASDTTAPTGNDVYVTCSDSDGCNYTPSETGAVHNRAITIWNTSANTVNMVPSAGVLTTCDTATYSLAQGQSTRIKYVTDSWYEVCESTDWADLRNVPAFRKTLVQLRPQANEPPASSFATMNTRNSHPALRFNGNVCAIWTFVMPNTYGGNGVTAELWVVSSETSNDTDWDGSWEKIETSQDIDSDSFATAVSADNNNNSATSGIATKVSIAFTNGAQMDSCASGELCRFRLCRDDTSDTGGADTIDYIGGELKETP